jgi:hypothetical protein
MELLGNISKDTDRNFSGGIGPDGYHIGIASRVFFYVFNDHFIIWRGALVISFDFKPDVLPVSCGCLGNLKIHIFVCWCEGYCGCYGRPRLSLQFDMLRGEVNKGFDLADEFNPDQGLGRIIGVDLQYFPDGLSAIPMGSQ